jgi:hypothetical protein
MLMELSVMELRYHAVMEAVSGAPVTEVARRYAFPARPCTCGWASYQREGIAGQAGHSHRPAAEELWHLHRPQPHHPARQARAAPGSMASGPCRAEIQFRLRRAVRAQPVSP